MACSWTALRRLLLGLALVGLVLAPLAAYAAHRSYDAAISAVSDKMPDRAHHQSNDCTCVTCSSDCSQVIGYEAAFPSVLTINHGLIIPLTSQFAAGISAAPPYEPPRA